MQFPGDRFSSRDNRDEFIDGPGKKSWEKAAFTLAGSDPSAVTESRRGDKAGHYSNVIMDRLQAI